MDVVILVAKGRGFSEVTPRTKIELETYGEI
jgi:hypothetical protein